MFTASPFKGARGARAVWAAALLHALGGCARDPVLLGFWEIEQVEVEVEPEAEPLRQDDMGTLEFTEDEATLVLRYTLVGGALQPVSAPRALTVEASTGDESDDLGASYQSEGEVHTVLLGFDTYEIDDYEGHRAQLWAEAAAPPGEIGAPVAAGRKLPLRWWLVR